MTALSPIMTRRGGDNSDLGLHDERSRDMEWIQLASTYKMPSAVKLREELRPQHCLSLQILHYYYHPSPSLLSPALRLADEDISSAKMCSGIPASASVEMPSLGIFPSGVSASWL